MQIGGYFFSFYKRHVTLRSVLKIYTYLVLPQLPGRKTCLSDGRIKCNWSISSKTLDTCWFNECFAGKSVAVSNSRKETVSLCAAVLLSFPLQALKQECDKHPVSSPELKQNVLLMSNCSVQQQQKSLNSADGDTNVAQFV